MSLGRHGGHGAILAVEGEEAKECARSLYKNGVYLDINIDRRGWRRADKILNLYDYLCRCWGVYRVVARK